MAAYILRAIREELIIPLVEVQEWAIVTNKLGLLPPNLVFPDQPVLIECMRSDVR